MNARLCSLLVAGGVVLAGIQGGSLSAAPLETGTVPRTAMLQGATLESIPGSEGTGALLNLAIPGFTGTPKLQVLANPLRVVVDLPGVNRGSQLSKRDLAALTHPLIEKYRVAQFAVSPQPITRLVLEVVPGTRVGVSRTDAGIQVSLAAGTGDVQAQLVVAPDVLSAKIPTAPAVEIVAVAEVPVVGTPEGTPSPMPLPEREGASAAPLPSLPSLPSLSSPSATVAAEPTKIVAADSQSVTAVPQTPASNPASTVPVPATAENVPQAASAPAVETAQNEPAVPAAVVTTPLPAEVEPVPVVGAPYRVLPALTATALMPLMPSSLNPVAAPPQDQPLGKGSTSSQQTGRTLGEQEARYTGAPMTIDIPSADLGTFLRIIADSMHLNLIMDQDVTGNFNFKFTDTPADLVLEMVLKNAGLGKEISHGVLRVAKVEKLQKEENDRKALAEAKALAGDLQTVSRPLSYAKVSDVKPIIEKVLTKRGSLIIDDRTNTLIISDLPRNLPLVDDLITQLDVQIQQVEISARVVEATGNFEKDFGVKWPTANGGSNNLVDANGNAANWMATNSPSWNSINNRPGAGQNTAAIGFAPGRTGVTDISSPAAEYWVSFLSSRVSINFILQALEKEGKVKIVSQPKLVTQNNKAAKILAGTKIPYPSQQGGAAGGAITVAFVEANLELEVTPQITNDNTILMDLKIEKSEADFSNTVQGTPTILRKAINTTVLVRDGGTAILGGVYSNKSSKGTTGVPFLSKLPLIGWLFRNNTNSETNAELLIFITPRIIKN